MLALEHHLEETRGLHDFPTGLGELAVGDPNRDVAVTFHAGQVMDVDVKIDLH